MDKSLQFFLTRKTNIELTQIALFIVQHQLETLYLERNSIKQTLPLDETKFQLNTDTINYCAEATLVLESMIRKQQN